MVRIFFLRAGSLLDMRTWIKCLKRRTTLYKSNQIMDQLQSWIEEVEYRKSELDEMKMMELLTLKGVLRNQNALNNFLLFLVLPCM